MRRRLSFGRLLAAVLAIVLLAATSPIAGVLAVAPRAPTPSVSGRSVSVPSVSLPPRSAEAAGRAAQAAFAPPAVETSDLDGWRAATAARTEAAPSPIGQRPSAVPAPSAAAKTTTAKRPVSPAVAPKRTTATSTPVAPVYRGTNHVWMPALGISRSVGWYPCGASAAPGRGVYRWGCAGTNNIYLLAHAYAAFAPLHDAYVSGRLRKGMQVIYADAHGRVHRYAIVWWRLTTPENGGFAFAAQSRPSMTLQTCVGAQSQYRLIVRLVEVG
jgi:hypothetical protein